MEWNELAPERKVGRHAKCAGEETEIGARQAAVASQRAYQAGR